MPSRPRSAYPVLCTLPLLAFLGCTLIGVDPDRDAALPLLDRDERTLQARLHGHVTYLAGTIGERNLANPATLKHAELYIAAELARAGFSVGWQTYAVNDHAVSNLEAEIPGRSPDPARAREIIVIGAHYDTINHRGVTTPGANDNASGVAAVLELARLLRDAAPARTIRFVLFTNEEPPYFWTDNMGSLVYARAAAQRGDPIVGMIAVESIGYYRQEQGSQSYPPLVGLAYPSTGNFIAFVGPNSNGSGDWIERCTASFRAASDVPAEGAALPSLVPRINSSDHWSFWKQGWPACMVTDTAPYRDPAYHKPTDTPDRLDYERMARVVEGLAAVLRDQASASPDERNR